MRTGDPNAKHLPLGTRITVPLRQRIWRGTFIKRDQAVPLPGEVLQPPVPAPTSVVKP